MPGVLTHPLTRRPRGAVTSRVPLEARRERQEVVTVKSKLENATVKDSKNFPALDLAV